MADTIETIIKDSTAEALGLPRDPLQVELRDIALASCNDKGRIIWDSWPWDNEKMDEFTAPTADADGIISFAATVETVRAIKSYGATGDDGTRIWNEDELIAAANGETVSSLRFQHLADGTGGIRRIRVYSVDAATSYKVLALRRFVPAVVDADYDSTDPTATPTDYRVLTFVIDRAEPALKAYVRDSLRKFQGISPERDGDPLLQLALKRETYDSDRERRMNPRAPLFTEIGEWR